MQAFSIWEQESFFAPQDLIIIGSGFCGLWTALKMAERYPDKSVTVLERGLIPTGASTRNAGFSCFGSPSELLEDVEKMGAARTFDLVEMRFRGLRQIAERFSAEQSGFEASGGYECYDADAGIWQTALERLPWLNGEMKRITGLDNSFEQADPLLQTFGFRGFRHLVRNRLEGGIHSGKVIRALLQQAQARGVQVFTGTEVTGFEKRTGEVEVHTRQQMRFRARQLLLCTNAFTRTLLPELDIVPNRGQVLLTAPLPGLRFRGTFHYDQGYYYFRNLGNRLLLGGARNQDFERECTTEIDITEKIQTELERFIRDHLLPETPFTITDRWSGIMAMGSDKMPLVHRLDENLYCCVRMSGMGVALAPEVADRVVNLIAQS